jgi:diguanylate cyclase (GGDEF)-like protein
MGVTLPCVRAMPIRFLLSLLLLTASAALAAQTLHPAYPEVVRRFSTHDGLPQNSVNAMVQDRDGFLWLGTFGGLARFDGSEFTVYRSLADSGPSSDRVLQLFEDARGQLWIGSEDAGVSVYRDGRFLRLDVCDGRCLVRRFVAAADHSIWVLSSAGTYRIDPRTLRTLEHYPQALDVAAALGGDEQLYVGGRGLWRIRQGRREPVPLPTGEDRINTLSSEGSVLWVGAGDGLYRYDTVRRQWLPEPAPVRGALALARDAQQRLWALDVDGRVFRDDDDGSGLRPLAVPALPASRSLLTDRDGNLWLGSNARGLLRIARSRIGLLNDARLGMDLPGLPVVGDGSGGLWLGTVCGGLRHWDAPSGRLRHWSLQPALGNDCVWSLHRDDAGGLWIGTVDGRVGYLSPAAQDDRAPRDSDAARSRAPRLIAQWADQLPIRALYRTAGNTLLVASGQNVSSIAVGPSGETAAPQPIPGLPGGVALIQPAQQGGLWLAGSEGVVRWQEQRVVERWNTGNGLSSRFVRSLYEQPDGTLWVGTYGGGLNRIAGGRVQRFDRGSGLFDDVVSCMLADAQGGLWLSGNRGISLLPAEQLARAAAGGDLSAIGFSESDGLEPAETNGGGQPACLRDSAGTLWFPLISGFAQIDPLALGRRRAQAPPVRFQSLLAGGRKLPLAAEVRLPPHSHDVEVAFTAINLSAPEKTRFRYRLSQPGQDPAWIDIGAQRSLHFPLLPWEDITLEIIARSDTGTWSATPARLRLRQPLPWYLSPLGLGTAAALALALLLVGWRLHDYRLRRHRDLLARLVRTRTLELEQANRRLADQAQRDPVTGIANHRHFVESQQRMWAQMQAQQRPLSLLMIDIDEFKRFNDHYGHRAGDDCLRTVAMAMAAQLREDGVLARYGGEEFVALLPDCDSQAARAVGERLRQAVLDCAVSHAPGARHRLVTVSIGCASKWPSADLSLTRLTDLADQALYRAKENGRNRVETA